jgi:hypothetical protein
VTPSSTSTQKKRKKRTNRKSNKSENAKEHSLKSRDRLLYKRNKKIFQQFKKKSSIVFGFFVSNRNKETNVV